MSKPKSDITDIRCTGFGHATESQSYLSITRADGTTERFGLTPSIVALLASEFASLNYKWNKPDAA